MGLMDEQSVAAFLSSRTRLRIADLISVRPRTLGELAELTGVSIQGVLRHLKKLLALGLIEEVRVSGKGISVRKVYRAKGYLVGDFSVGDLTVVKVAESEPGRVTSKDPVGDLDYLAEEALVRRRRIRDAAKRLGKMIDQLSEDEARMRGILEALDIGDEEKLVLQVVYTEDSADERERTLSKHYGIEEGRRSIDAALGKANRSAKK